MSIEDLKEHQQLIISKLSSDLQAKERETISLLEKKRDFLHKYNQQLVFAKSYLMDIAMEPRFKILNPQFDQSKMELTLTKDSKTMVLTLSADDEQMKVRIARKNAAIDESIQSMENEEDFITTDELTTGMIDHHIKQIMNILYGF
jgi:hypothetical protein